MERHVQWNAIGILWQSIWKQIDSIYTHTTSSGCISVCVSSWPPPLPSLVHFRLNSTTLIPRRTPYGWLVSNGVHCEKESEQKIDDGKRGGDVDEADRMKSVANTAEVSVQIESICFRIDRHNSTSMYTNLLLKQHNNPVATTRIFNIRYVSIRCLIISTERKERIKKTKTQFIVAYFDSSRAYRLRNSSSPKWRSEFSQSNFRVVFRLISNEWWIGSCCLFSSPFLCSPRITRCIQIAETNWISSVMVKLKSVWIFHWNRRI